MSRFGEIYERVRPLIIWLGLGELAWIGFWLLNFGDTTTLYMVTAVDCLDVMYAKGPYTVIQRAVHIHPTVTELIPTMLGDLKPLE